MEEVNVKGFKDKLETEYREVEASIKKPNVLLVGGTGGGKSSLINLIFGQELADVGVGQPITDEINCYQNSNTSVVLYDTAGYEIGAEKQKEFFDGVVDFAIDNQKSTKNQIHLVWYCIDAAGHRITDLDLNVIKKIYNANLPIAVIFTKCDRVTLNQIKELEKEIKNQLPYLDTFRLTTLDIPKLDYLDLNKLTEWSVERLPAGLKLGFIKAQKQNLEQKREEAKKLVKTHVSGAVLIGGSPIPFSDGPLLIANQAKLFAGVLSIYDMKNVLGDIKTISSGVGIQKMISGSGIWLSGQLAKFIPIKGSIIGGLISATVAASITTAIGLAVSEMCYKLSKAKLEGKEDMLEDIITNFKPMFAQLFQEYYKTKGKAI